jgi:hypothetical protein
LARLGSVVLKREGITSQSVVLSFVFVRMMLKTGDLSFRFTTFLTALPWSASLRLGIGFSPQA